MFNYVTVSRRLLTHGTIMLAKRLPMKTKSLFFALCVGLLSLLNSVASALQDRNCEGDTVKISSLELLSSPSSVVLAKLDVAQGKIFFTGADGKQTSIPLICSRNRRFIIPAVVSSRVRSGDYNIRATIVSKKSSSRRWYGENLRDLAVRFVVGKRPNGRYQEVFNHLERGKPFDMCGTKSASGNLIACKSIGLVGSGIYDLQIRACSVTKTLFGNERTSCREPDIMLQGILEFQ